MEQYVINKYNKYNDLICIMVNFLELFGAVNLTFGKGEAESSILSSGTIICFTAVQLRLTPPTGRARARSSTWPPGAACSKFFSLGSEMCIISLRLAASRSLLILS